MGPSILLPTPEVIHLYPLMSVGGRISLGEMAMKSIHIIHNEEWSLKRKFREVTRGDFLERLEAVADQIATVQCI
jgi:hypothetical protein